MLKKSVCLDLVELVFKDQYFNGNDMLRIKKFIENSCVYMKKTIECCGMRCIVRDMWSPNGDLVTCGLITDKTRVRLGHIAILIYFNDTLLNLTRQLAELSW